jgi:tRNA/rRNA methyltransferase
MKQTLLDIDYLDPQNPEHILRSFRRIFGRAGLNDREVRILQGLWSRIDWMEGERKKAAMRDERPRDEGRGTRNENE